MSDNAAPEQTAQEQYDSSPELRDLLSRAMLAPCVSGRRHRKVGATTDTGGPAGQDS
jgi:hypothetical protein